MLVQRMKEMEKEYLRKIEVIISLIAEKEVITK
jgi:hypothetical protein